jgi:hypothetical protein
MGVASRPLNPEGRAGARRSMPSDPAVERTAYVAGGFRCHRLGARREPPRRRRRPMQPRAGPAPPGPHDQHVGLSNRSRLECHRSGCRRMAEPA